VLLPKKIDLILDAFKLILSNLKLQSTRSSPIVGGREDVNDMIGETHLLVPATWFTETTAPACGTVSTL
jgi:hypothetical protein